ncbi:Na/Pi cotransporter family protein [Candidatus Falkowbacteria bacterium]|nr:Na/Pi cotransporter family protein [Candidatus Falkowbacteria bacterium]
MTPGEIIMQILSLAGAAVIFLYGMKTMSESLQKLAGERLRRLLARITSNPFRGIITGMGVTAIVQSSSAVTVMLVSFVNAGLITFTQSLGVIFGANIGTTATAWLIYGLGFGTTFNIQHLLLPLAALALPLLFIRKAKNKAFAEMIIGFVLLFTGVLFFRETLPAIDENFALFHQTFFPDNFYLNTFSFVLIGIIVTLIFQSSSATIALTMVLASQGWLTYSAALAMVLGENVGTALTANLAAIVTNRAGKRTALAHLLFNVAGVVWVFPFIGIISNALAGFTTLATHAGNSIPLGLAIFHTLFNIINTLIILALFLPFSKICFALLPEQKSTAKRFSLKFLSINLLSTAELNILQDKKKLADFTKIISEMFTIVSSLLNEKVDRKFAKKHKTLRHNYKTVKETQQEIDVYLHSLSQEQLTPKGGAHLKAMAQINENLADMAATTIKMAQVIEHKNDAKAWFSQELRNKLTHSLQLIPEALAHKNGLADGGFSNPTDSPGNRLRLYLETLSQEPDALTTQIASNAASHYQQLLHLIVTSDELVSRVDAAALKLYENIPLRNNQTKNKF